MTAKHLLTFSLLTFTLTSNAVYADPVAGGKHYLSHELRASSLADNLAVGFGRAFDLPREAELAMAKVAMITVRPVSVALTRWTEIEPVDMLAIVVAQR
jgi:hypothetical protein